MDKEVKTKLTDSLKQTALLFRIGCIGAANKSLVDTIDILDRYFAHTENGIPEQAQLASLYALEAQQKHDYLFLADILEHQIANMLEEQ